MVMRSWIRVTRYWNKDTDRTQIQHQKPFSRRFAYGQNWSFPCRLLYRRKTQRNVLFSGKLYWNTRRALMYKQNGKGGGVHVHSHSIIRTLPTKHSRDWSKNTEKVFFFKNEKTLLTWTEAWSYKSESEQPGHGNWEDLKSMFALISI